MLRLAFVLWGVWCVSTGFATQFLPLPIENLARSADVVVRGEVLSRRCERDARGRLTTRVELSVSEVWKGPQTQRFTVVQAGGTLGEERQTIIGQAEYRPGEEVVAFLAVNRFGEGVTLGMAHGKFSLTRAPDGELRAQSAFHGHDSAPTPAAPRHAANALGTSTAATLAANRALVSPLTVAHLKHLVSQSAR